MRAFFLTFVLLLCAVSLYARRAPKHDIFVCSTAGTGGVLFNPFELGCDCLQEGWVFPGMVVIDGPAHCDKSFRINDRCNFDGQCAGSSLWYIGSGIADVQSGRDTIAVFDVTTNQTP